MVESASINGHEPGLGEFLARRARTASESRLTLDVAVGLVAVIVAAALKPDWWLPLGSAGSVFVAFGIWAILDRITLSATSQPRVAVMLKPARILVAAIGIISAAALLFFLWAMSIGTWIS
jgi:hypothetical protein